MRRLSAGAALVVALIIGCGSPSAGGEATTASAQTPVTVTEADFGQTIKVAPGRHLKVELTDRRPVPGSSLVWTVTSTDPAVLELVSAEHGSAAPLRDSTYVAIFVARSRGTAAIHAAGATTCEAMLKSACPDRAAEIAIEVG